MSKELVLVISKMIKEWCECTSSACPRQKMALFYEDKKEKEKEEK